MDARLLGTGTTNGTTTPASAAVAPSIALIHVLVKTFSAIGLGFFAVQLKYVKPKDGDMKALGFYVGKICLPLLIFRTIVTSDLQGISWGLIAACNLAKAVVFIMIFIASWAFGSAKGTGHKLVSATINSMFAVASNDFAIGFPVIDALYPVMTTVQSGDGGLSSDMVPHLAVNALIGAAVFIPFGLILLQVGQSVSSPGQSDLASNMFTSVAGHVLCNPVIVCTLAGFAWRTFGPMKLDSQGNLLIVDGRSALPDPLQDVVSLFTSPFAMLALFMTGASLKKMSLGTKPVMLVTAKVIMCAALGFWMATKFIDVSASGLSQDLQEQLNDRFVNFAYLYGSIPTSSAPLVLAYEFVPSAADAIASAILFGLLVAGPSMFLSSIIFEKSIESLTPVLHGMSVYTSWASVICSSFACLIFFFGRSWFWTHPLKLFVLYAVATFLYASHLCILSGAGCTTARKEWERTSESNSFFIPGGAFIIMLGFLQYLPRIIILLMMLMRSWNYPKLNLNTIASICCVLALLCAFFITPNLVNEICDLKPSPRLLGRAYFGTSAILAAQIIIGLAPRFCDRCCCKAEHVEMQSDRIEELDRARRARSSTFLPRIEAPRVPIAIGGVIDALALYHFVRGALQFVLITLFYFEADVALSGSLLQLLIIEQFLEQAQGIVSLLIILFNDKLFEATSVLIGLPEEVVLQNQEHAPPKVKQAFQRISDQAREILKPRRWLWVEYPANIIGNQVVDLLVQSGLEEKEAIDLAEELVRYSFLSHVDGRAYQFATQQWYFINLTAKRPPAHIRFKSALFDVMVDYSSFKMPSETSISRIEMSSTLSEAGNSFNLSESGAAL